jgi:hypothetical protein
VSHGKKLSEDIKKMKVHVGTCKFLVLFVHKVQRPVTMEIEFSSSQSEGSDDDSAELVEQSKTALADIEVKFLEEEEHARRYKEHIFIAVCNRNHSLNLVSHC